MRRRSLELANTSSKRKLERLLGEGVVGSHPQKIISDISTHSEEVYKTQIIIHHTLKKLYLTFI